MARLPLVDLEKVTDPEILGILLWLQRWRARFPTILRSS